MNLFCLWVKVAQIQGNPLEWLSCVTPSLDGLKNSGAGIRLETYHRAYFVNPGYRSTNISSLCLHLQTKPRDLHFPGKHATPSWNPSTKHLLSEKKSLISIYLCVSGPPWNALVQTPKHSGYLYNHVSENLTFCKFFGVSGSRLPPPMTFKP